MYANIYDEMSQRLKEQFPTWTLKRREAAMEEALAAADPRAALDEILANPPPPPIVLIDEPLNAVLVYLRGGSGIDDLLCDSIDEALTGSPARSIFILIERPPLSGQPLTLAELLAANRQPVQPVEEVQS